MVNLWLLMVDDGESITDWWLTNPSEKKLLVTWDEYSQLNGKIKAMFQSPPTSDHTKHTNLCIQRHHQEQLAKPPRKKPWKTPNSEGRWSIPSHWKIPVISHSKVISKPVSQVLGWLGKQPNILYQTVLAAIKICKINPERWRLQWNIHHLQMMFPAK